MKVPIYKSLDKPSSMFGLKGRYAFFAGVGAVATLVLAFLIGSASNGLVGILSFVAMAAAVYLGVLRVQAQYSERQLTKMLSGRGLADWVRVHPERMSRYIGLEKKDKTA